MEPIFVAFRQFSLNWHFPNEIWVVIPLAILLLIHFLSDKWKVKILAVIPAALFLVFVGAAFTHTAEIEPETILIHNNWSMVFHKTTVIPADMLDKVDLVKICEESIAIEIDYIKGSNPPYTVTLTRREAMDSIINIHRRYGYSWQFKAEDKAKNWLLEFNNKQAKSLSQYYNPYSKVQQKDFERQVRAYLEPLVQKEWGGDIRVSGVEFQF